MIDVVIPVFRGLEQTRRCIDSVLASRQSVPHEIVVIDDASPDAQIAACVHALAAQGRVTLLRNESNQGFVRSVNRGMALHADRDVVLLNSDTEVANDWLDRLHAAAHAAGDIATATPFSNNATICTYPFEGWGGRVPGTLDLAAFDRLVARANAGRRLDIPTAVGFCMYIRRESLQRLGPFDAERFGRGYGEENDFCMRALKAGLRNVLAADVFVYHEGSVSFSEERFALMKAATQSLLAVHPDYTRRVHEFIIEDPAHALRATIDMARIAVGPDEARHVLDERYEERSRLVRGLWEIEKLAQERDTLAGQVHQLHYALEHASALVAERDRVIGERDTFLLQQRDEIGRLRQGLAHAEMLAFQRADELERIRSFWLVRGLSYLRLWRKPRAS